METNNTVKTTVELDATQAQQEIAKLNAVASDSTRDLEERLEAKNKQVELQNKLSKKTIESIEKEVKELKDQDAELGKILKAETRLNKAKIQATKQSENNAKAQNKLSTALSDSKDSFKELDGATGGVITSFKTLLSNPIGLFITAIVGAFSALKEAVNRSGKASETFGKIGAKLSGIFNGLIAVLEPLVEFIGEKLLDALNDPKQAFLDLGETIQNNVINRFKALSVLGGAIAKLFKGDFKGAAKDATDGIVQLTTGITDATDKAQEFGKEAVKNFNEAAKATNNLANAERQLVKNRIALEKQQLTSLRLAEEQRQIRDDTSKTIEERIAANQRLGEILDQQLQKELALAQQTLNLAKAQQTATGDTIENLEAVGDAELKLLEIRERITGQRSEQLTNENALLKEQADKKKQAEDLARQAEEKRIENQNELDALEIERKKLNGENTLALELDLLEKKRIQDTEALNLSNEEIQIINERAAIDKENLLNREAESLRVVEDTKQIIRDKGLDNISAGIGILSSLAGENEALQAASLIAEHGVSIAKTIISTQSANAIATAEGAALAIPTAGASVAAAAGIVTGNNISAGISIAGQGLALAKGLASLKKSSSKGGGGSSPSGLNSSGGGSTNITPEVITDLSANSAANLGVNTDLGDNATATASNNISATTQGEVIFSESKFNEFQNQVAFKEDKTTIS